MPSSKPSLKVSIQKDSQNSQVDVWRPIKGYEKLYRVSNMGFIQSLDKHRAWRNGKTRFVRGRVLSPSSTKGNGDGYFFVGLTKDGVTKYFTIHKLVALHFCENPLNKPEVNHDDCDIHNNRATNLWWCTKKENAEHRMKYGTVMNGENHVCSKLNENEVIELRKMYKKGIKLSELLKLHPHGSSQGIHNAIVGKSWKHLNSRESPASLRRDKHNSGFPGVSFEKSSKKWRGRIKKNGKWKDAGRHNTAKQAHAALKLI